MSVVAAAAATAAAARSEAGGISSSPDPSIGRSPIMGRKPNGNSSRIVLAVFRAVREDMRQVLAHLVLLHGERILTCVCTAASLATGPTELAELFEGLSGDHLSFEGGGLTPYAFARALTAAGYDRRFMLNFLGVAGDAPSSATVCREGAEEEDRPSVVAARQLSIAEGSFVRVVGQEHDCQVLYVSGSHVKLALSFGRSTFVPLASVGQGASLDDGVSGVGDNIADSADTESSDRWQEVAENGGVDFAAAVPFRLPHPPVPCCGNRPLSTEEAPMFVADMRRVRWQYQPGTMWSDFDSTTATMLEESFHSGRGLPSTFEQTTSSIVSEHDVLLSATARSLMSITAMKSGTVHELELGRDLPLKLQLDPGPQSSWPTFPATGGQIAIITHESTDHRERDGVIQLGIWLAESLHAAVQCSTIMAAPWAVVEEDVDADCADITLRLCAADDATYIDGEHSFCLAIRHASTSTLSDSMPDSGSVLANATGLGGLTRAVHLLQRSLVSTAPELFAETGSMVLPACFFVDSLTAEQARYHRIYAGLTTRWQTCAAFMEAARAADRCHPSHSRRVRRRVFYERSDGARLQLHPVHMRDTVSDDPPVVTLVQMKSTFDAVDSSKSCLVQGHSRYGSGELLSVPLARLMVPPQMSSGLDWNHAECATRSSSGKAGCWFVQFGATSLQSSDQATRTAGKPKQVVVLKFTESPASELAASLLCQSPLLSRLVDTPPLLAGSVEWGEGAAAYAAMRRLRDAGAIQGPWQRGIGQRYRYFVLQEYVEGQTLKDLCYDVAAHSESAPAGVDCVGSGEPSSPRTAVSPASGQVNVNFIGAETLRQLGSLVAFDVLTHNADRLFLDGLFNNFSKCGNLANLIMPTGGEHEPLGVVAIDNATGCFDVEMVGSANCKRFAAFCDGVRHLASSVRRRVADVDAMAGADGPSVPRVPAHPAMAAIRRLLRDGQGVCGEASFAPAMGHDIGESGICLLERGFMRVLDRLATVARGDAGSILKILEQVKSNVEVQLGVRAHGSAAELNRVDVARVNVSFLHKVATAMLEDVDVQAKQEAKPNISSSTQTVTDATDTCAHVAADACAHVSIEEAFPSWDTFHRRTARLKQSFQTLSTA